METENLTDLEVLTETASTTLDLTSINESLENLSSILSNIESSLNLVFLFILIFYGSYLFRLAVLGKNQRNLW